MDVGKDAESDAVSWKSLVHHKSTLKIFVHHQRKFNRANDSQGMFDCPALSFPLQDVAGG